MRFWELLGRAKLRKVPSSAGTLGIDRQDGVVIILGQRVYLMVPRVAVVVVEWL